jgi:hypothetical protein
VANNQKRKPDDGLVVPRGRLKEARKWFEHNGWDELPQGERGDRILRWGADHAWLASPADPRRSVRRWCRCWSPRLTASELDEIVAVTAHSNKRWSADQSATVLGITVRDRSTLGLRFIGAADDPNYAVRHDIKRAKDAERARRSRAARSTGAKRGRPKSEGLPAWEVLGISKRTYFRWRKAGKMIPGETSTKIGRKPLISSDVGGAKNASRHLSNNKKPDGISVPSEIRVTTPPADAFNTTKQFLMTLQSAMRALLEAPRAAPSGAAATPTIEPAKSSALKDNIAVRFLSLQYNGHWASIARSPEASVDPRSRP